MTWGCSQSPQSPGTSSDAALDAKPRVMVSILPQRYFVQRIAGPDYPVDVMIPPGHSPATYEPTPQEMTTLSKSALYLRIGHIAFEKVWMEKISSLNKKMTVTDTSVGVQLITGMPAHSHGHETGETEHPKDLLTRDDGHDHSQCTHDHGGIDPHIWLSPNAVAVMAKNIKDAFIKLVPKDREIFEKNYRAFLADIDALKAENDALLAALKGKKFMVFHPAWSYLARDYGMVQYPIEIDGKSPGPAALKEMIDLARKENIKVIFVQKQFDSSSAQTVAAEIGGKVIAMDPLAPDWLTNMKKIAKVFKENLSGTK